MTSAMAAAVAVDLATAAATIAATFRARGNNSSSSPAAQFLPGPPVSDAIADHHHHHGGPITEDSRGIGAVSLRPPQLHVPELSTSQGPAAEEQRRRQLAHRHGGPFDTSAPAMPTQQQQQQQGRPAAQGSVPVVPDWARGLPPEVQAELLRAIATAHLTNAQEHGQPAG